MLSASPIATAQTQMTATSIAINGMSIVSQYEGGASEASRLAKLGICDVSALSRFGVKGANAEEWLQHCQINTPAQPNTWLTTTNHSLVLRLGKSEFLVEDSPSVALCQDLSKAASSAGVYPVARYDASFILCGEHVHDLLSELCSLDLAMELKAQRLVMTQVAGISATLIQQNLAGKAVYRLWCDGSYGAYMWHSLIGIAQEFEGGAVGLQHFFSI
jgi:sarcosine oxidase, subunit gamma